MKYIITGRAGTGKNTLLDMLTQRGMTPLITNTTRNIRGPKDSNHIFITKDQAAAIPKENKFLYTVLNNEEYFTTQKDIEDANVIVVEPTGIWELLNEFPEESFHIVHITDVDQQLRCKFATSCYTDQNVANADFAQRIIDEEPRFKKFEEHLQKMNEEKVALAPNANRLLEIKNDYVSETLEAWADWMVAQHRLFNNLKTIVQQCIDLHTININEKGEIPIKDYENNVRYVNLSYFIDMIMNDEQSMNILMHGWLSHKVNIGIPEELLITPENSSAETENNITSETESSDSKDGIYKDETPF